ncbi:hypothetical protein CXF65_04370 [Psychrobacter sp. Sarcosine-3u-12]|nr:hypothetical protein CXF65_04370 [Psychrobacter sp. Sarcosine-3u-12]
MVKDDTVVFEDGDFEEYNTEHDYEEGTENSAAKKNKSEKSSKNKDSEKEQKSDKKDKASSADKESKSNEDDETVKDGKSSKKDKASKKDGADQEDKSGITMAGIYQWASKLKDDFTSDASGMTHDVSEKATAMMLGKLLNAVDLELAAFDKSLDVAKNLVATAEERRKKIAAKKEKYQGMIDELDQE